MPGITTLGMVSTGHSSFPPTPSTSASSDVFVEGIGAVKVGDSYAPHGSPSPSPTHSRTLSGGSSTVYVNGQPVGRIGDDISCGDAVGECNTSVFAGG